MSWSLHVATIFPDFFVSPLETSIVRRAREAGLLDVTVHDIRERATDRHRTTDDTPYGGGAGMVMKAGPLVDTLEFADEMAKRRLHRVLLTPQGRPFSQVHAAELAAVDDGIILICGRYEGFDERVREHFVDETLSVGDYVLTGGEPAALIVLDAVIRLRPGVLGNAESARDESFGGEGSMLEYPQYTRPYEFRGHTVPDVLRSGDHGRVAQWRREQSILRTLSNRPDLFASLWPRLDTETRAWVVNEAGADRVSAALGEPIEP